MPRRLLLAACLLAFGSVSRSDVAVSLEIDPAAEPATEPAAGSAAPLKRAAGPAALPPRPSAARPGMSDQQRAEWAARLRELYARPAAEWPAPHVDSTVEWVEIGLLPDPTHPADNPFSQAKADLGRLLFFDPRLSQGGQMACASCHDPDLGWADGRTVSFGLDRKPLARNAPTVLNAAFQKQFFWDGRAESLEVQARHVMLNPAEMAGTEERVEATLAAIPAYRQAFADAFGCEDISFDLVGKALATYERTLVGGHSRFDAFLHGRHDALDDRQIIGLHLYRTQARCMNCHHGPSFSDGQLHNLGLSYYGRKFEDLGAYKTTGKAEDVGKFRTPTLRNIANTGPYMHNGLFELPGVLNMYNAGMPTLRRKEHQADDPLFPTKSPLLKPLSLSRQDLGDLLAFLEALSEPPRRVRPPELP
ncbi:MAG: Cytochrome peroxidase precursor [Planctomycetota bacterium]